MDFAVPGGWHVTIFWPWGWVAIALIALLACAALTKFIATR